MNLNTPTDLAGRTLASWPTRHPWLWAILLGLGGLFLTAFGIGYAQARNLDQVSATYAQAAATAVSALFGLLIMWLTRPSLASYGFRRPTTLREVLWALPLVALPVIVVASSSFKVSPAQALAYAVTTVAVGFNEEIWFRGLQLAALRRLGVRRSVVGGAAIFAAFHLTNFFAGRPPLYLFLQFVFAALVGIVLAQVATITGSLWLGIVWHFMYDFTAYGTGDSLSTGELIGIAAMIAVLTGYAIWLWKRLGSEPSSR